ncbi:hypothetical protein EWB00_003740, partial [Schistosoma japonicum]
DVSQALLRGLDQRSSSLSGLRRLSLMTINDHRAMYHKFIEVGIIPFNAIPE